MKKKLCFYLCGLFILSVTGGCATHIKVHSKPAKPHKVKTIPPGQAKKITGSKSAKPFAPGHHK